MKKPKHTPGPWITQPNASEQNTVMISPSEKNWSAIAIVYLESDENGYNDANARLIAAAPEMLGVLKAILKNIEEGSVVLKFTPIENGYPHRPDLKLQALKKLIAQAGGRDDD